MDQEILAQLAPMETIQEFCEPPLWIIRNAMVIGWSYKFPKMNILDTRPRCQACLKGVDFLVTDFGTQQKICRVCDQERMQARSKARWLESDDRKRKARQHAIVAVGTMGYSTHASWSRRHLSECPGNITNDMYRYLVGATVGTSKFTMCRVCGKTMYGGKEEWIDHNGRSGKSATGLACSVILIKAAKLLGDCCQCAVCGKHTKAELWGVPICDTEDCIKDWKFNQRQSDTLKMALEQVIEEQLSQLNATP